ncbi:MAG: RNA methyltransferase substrate-binding domain-containing protein [Actinomycetota bacterium]
MAGNSSRKGAVRGSKKGPTVGSGGNNKRRLSGKGPTPKQKYRPYHAAAKRKKAATATKPRTTTRTSSRSERPKGGGELVAGRNAVVEALREGVPATELIIARSIDVDDRITESLKLALALHLPIREVHRAEVEGLSGSSQGILLAIKPFQYSSFDEIVIRDNKALFDCGT